jgi:CBS domain-containing protein
MQVEQLLSSKNKTVVTVGSLETVSEAVSGLAANNIGAILVLDEDGVLSGIISERDIVNGLEKFGETLLDERADVLAVKSLITCGPKDDIFEVIWLMDANHIRHLPVVDGRNLVGVISIRDIMKFLLHATDEQSKQLRAVALT